MPHRATPFNISTGTRNIRKGKKAMDVENLLIAAGTLLVMAASLVWSLRLDDASDAMPVSAADGCRAASDLAVVRPMVRGGRRSPLVAATPMCGRERFERGRLLRGA
jgi:hypothetical protein